MIKGINVLSLFDGCSGGQQALDRLDIKVDNYYASEIDKYAIQVTMANYPNTIQLGSVVDVDVTKLEKIDLLCGGSPCQSFSFAGKRKGMSTKDSIEILTLEHYLDLKSQNFEFEGQSYLFWEYIRILTDIRKYNPDVKFLLENVMMGAKWQKVLANGIGINPIEINSSLLSAQNRRRLYFTNIGAEQDGLFGDLVCKIPQPKDMGILLKDILEEQVDDRYYLSSKMLELLTFKDKGNGEVANINKGGERGSVYDENYKMSTLCATDYKQPKQIICHNTMPRSSKTGKGGTGPLSRDDGKTYCLDTGRTNAIEIKHKYHDEIQKSLSNEKSTTLDASYYKGFGVRSGACRQVASNESRIRRLTPLECERLQCIKDNYTAHVSDTQRYKMIGNGWTISVISHIFSSLKA